MKEEILLLKPYEVLKSIGNVDSFTPREIDVLACIFGGKTILTGRAAHKKIAVFLSRSQKAVSPRTVETHIRNITRKLGGGSQEFIINLIESSEKYLDIRKHYWRLYFEKILDDFCTKISPKFLYVYKRDYEYKFIDLLFAHLEMAGITVVGTKDNENIDNKIQAPNHFLYILSRNPDKESFVREVQKRIETLKSISSDFTHPKYHTFLMFDGTADNIPQEFSTFGKINKEEQENHYTLVFKILQRTDPSIDFSKAKLEFKNIPSFSNEDFSKDKLPHKKSTFYFHDLLYLFNPRKTSIFLFIMVSASFLYLIDWFIYKNNFLENNNSKILIRSDLMLPIQQTLLHRLYLMQEIQKKMKGKQQIQTVILTGMGGVGKTTSARQFCLFNKVSIIWELNAETEFSLIKSFQDLANELANTKYLKEKLMLIQNIQDFDEKNKQLLLFVKKLLKQNSDWILIYDNIEDFSIAKLYLPKNPHVWGQGKVIITTRNANVKGIDYLSSENIIHIEELTEQECLTLLCKILYKCEPHKDLPIRKEDAVSFFRTIPHFPLDISIVASYIAATGVSFNKYLDRIKNNKFDETQKIIVSDLMGYNYTRKEIVLLTIESMVHCNEKFEDLLVMLGLIDSKNVPRSLLEFHSNQITADLFFYKLKKNSFITSEISTGSENIFSVHDCVHDFLAEYISVKPTLIINALNIIQDYLDAIIFNEDFSQMKIIQPHVKKILKRNNFPDLEIARLRSKLAIINTHLGGDSVEVVNELKLNLNILEKDLIKNKTHIAQALLYLGDAYKRLGKYEIAIQVLKKCVRICQGFDTHKIVQSQALTFLGTIYRILGQYKTAKDFLLKSQNIYKNISQKRNAKAQNYVYLGLAYRDLGQYNLAARTIEEGLSCWEENGSDSMWYSWGSAYLASVFNKLGEYKKALMFIKKSIDIHKKGVNSKIWLAWADTVLAQTYLGLKKYSESKILLEQSRKIYEIKHTDNYVYFSMLLPLLGEVYAHLGQKNESREVLDLSLVLSKKKIRRKTYSNCLY